jgi:hypothetical protein
VSNQDKLDTLSVLEGLTVEDMLNQATLDSIVKGMVKGICSELGCNYTTEVEPDQDQGHCEKCGGQTVTSCMVLAGLK